VPEINQAAVLRQTRSNDRTFPMDEAFRYQSSNTIFAVHTVRLRQKVALAADTSHLSILQTKHGPNTTFHTIAVLLIYRTSTMHRARIRNSNLPRRGACQSLKITSFGIALAHIRHQRSLLSFTCRQDRI
jgi:hypothetical protein